MTVGTIVGTFSRADGIQRVVVVEREDGLFTFQLQWAERGGGWGLRGLDCGIYDSPETAVSEATQRVWWLRAMVEPEEYRPATGQERTVACVREEVIAD